MLKNSITFKVYGKYALFTDPLTKIGGEKFSYDVPTYGALKGITESIYWKPTFIWVIDEVTVMKPIQTQSKGVRPLRYSSDSPLLSIYTYLYDVEYIVKAHFEWNENRPDLAKDRFEQKHWEIAERMIERGGRRDIFLGTRECQGYVEPCDLDSKDGFYANIAQRAFGYMVHGITYPDEQTGEAYDKKLMSVRLWRPVMKHGTIAFPRPDDKSLIIREIGPREGKDFSEGVNFLGWQEFEQKGAW